MQCPAVLKNKRIKGIRKVTIKNVINKKALSVYGVDFCTYYGELGFVSYRKHGFNEGDAPGGCVLVNQMPMQVSGLSAEVVVKDHPAYFNYV